jgi:hypothetical protein
MTYGRVGYVERERRELAFLNYVEPLRSPLAAADGEALAYIGYFAELIDEWAPDGDPNETLFRLGATLIDALAAGVPVEPLARYFEFWLLRIQGVYQPDPKASREAQAFLQAARTCSPFALTAQTASPKALRELEASHRAMMAVHLDRELRSTKVLRELRRT